MVIRAIGIRADLAVIPVCHEKFNVIFLRRYAPYVAGAYVDNAELYAEAFQQLLRILLEFLMKFPRIFRPAKYELLNFVELVNAEYSLGIFAVRAYLLAKARRNACKFHGHIFLNHYLISKHRAYRMLGRCNHVQVFIFYLVHHALKVFKGYNSFVSFPSHHERRLYEFQPPLSEKIDRIPDYCHVKYGKLFLKIKESGTGNL